MLTFANDNNLILKMKNQTLTTMMKGWVLSIVLLAMPLIGSAVDLSSPIRVGVFRGHGGAETCIWEAVAAIRLDPEMTVRTVTTAQIAGGVLDSLDAIIVPGGGGSTQFLNLGTENQRRIKAFVAAGKGAVGICAGAYLFSDTPNYACMRINGAKAIDIEHDNRGHGIAKFSLTKVGRDLFPELAARTLSYVMYYEGPVFVKSDTSSIHYTTFAMMESDVHEEGDAPANMTNDKPFFIGNDYGRGRVFCSIAHPEATPGMMWMIPRIVRWTLRKPVKTYKSRVVNADIYNREYLMTKADLKRERLCYETFLYGSAGEKIAALDWLQERRSWDAKRWVQGLLFDGAPQVRVRAARFIAETDYLPFLPDMEAACSTESDVATKMEIERYLQSLRHCLP